MPTKEHAERMSRALESTGLIAPVSANFGENRIAILCRVPKDNEAKWVELITNILIGANLSSRTATAWQCHICRNYFLKEVNGEDKLVWGWNFSVQAREMSLAMDSIIRITKGQPVKDQFPGELTEFPLRASPNRNSMVLGGKGVHTIGGSDDHRWGKK